MCAGLISMVVGLGLLIVSAPTASAATIGDVTGFEADGGTYTISAGPAKARVVFYERDLFRIWMAPDGELTDPAGDAIVVRRDLEPHRTGWSDRGDHYRISSAALTLRVYKRPLRFALYETGSRTPLWEEAQGLTWDADGTTQTLRRGVSEQFFGGGMQNGRFSHRGNAIDVARSFDWEDGGNPNPSPFYMSTAGYGSYRNTFAPGRYDFGDPVATRHAEQRFDSFYFYGPSLKRILDGYTELTGRPFLPPIYGLELGDADCYNSPPQTTLDALAVADGYVENDMPRGWMLVNDGYGCGYQELERVGQELLERDITLGLWTENGVPNQEYEVGTAGVRVRKLDVAWVGPGYEFALDACEQAYDGIERYSDARGYVWMVEGWAGAQRCAVQWTGDQSGSWENIRFHVPTIHGSGLSGIAWTAGDVDGIFGGSPETYVRDLQWKAFNPVLMTMSGWAPTDKQPWRYGEPYTSINRRYLKLRERLMPYLYTYAAEAHRSGVPPVRSLVLEYPDDPRTWDDTTKYEFLAGESFLVAPVFEDSAVRDGIYLPEGRWVDYWTGRVYEGPRTVNDYAAPLDRLPLFVKAGAVVPMWPEGVNNHREVAPGAPLTIDLYPSGHSAFTLYEDDGVTRAHRSGAFAEQRIESRAPKRGRGKVAVTLGASRGHYAGKPAQRPYELTVHTGTRPATVAVGHRRLGELLSAAALAGADQGWWYDGSVVHVKTAPMSTAFPFTVSLHGTSAVGGAPHGPAEPDADVELELPDRVEQGFANEIAATFTNNNAETVRDVELSLELPGGWTAEATTPATAGRIEPGGTLRTTFAVTPPADAPQADFAVMGIGEYTLRGRRLSATEAGTVRTLPTPPSTDTYVSDMEWLVAENGWGPAERDIANGESAAGDGTPISLDGVVYERGVGAHAVSRIQLYLGGRCNRLEAKVGVDDSRGPNGSISFEVHADGQRIYDSGLMRGATPTQTVDLPLAGTRFLELVITDGGDGKNADHGNWADAKVTCGG